MRSGNPVLNSNVFQQPSYGQVGGTMTVQGTVNKAFVMLFLVLLTASWTWSQVDLTPLAYEGAQASGIPSNVQIAMAIGGFGGFIVAMVTVFQKKWAAITAPLYALLKGLFLGGISAIFEMSYPGIAMQAVMLTFGVMLALLMMYKSGVIKVTDRMRKMIVAATFGIVIVYVGSMLLGFFGVSIPLIFGSGPVGIGFSLLVCGIAAFNLVLDFDFIERGSQMGTPKYLEWYGAFGLMVSLIWLYLEIIRLLAKTRR